ncbi:MAG: ABC transporter permease [Verrucomicrobia bacterium]|jgi:putative ABC transport system permease protein|nr:ABC transporter permease [Verrucomicrobiota bacterium]
MRALLLSWRYICAHRAKSGILLVCLTITIFLPLAVHVMIGHYEQELMARARSTPLVVGAKGNRYDLVLKSLYFTAENPEPISMRVVESIRDTGWAGVLPLHVVYTARGYPIVGTVLEYFSFRGLQTAEGTLPLRIGDAVLGAEVARELGLKPQDRIITDQTSLYDLAAVYPLKMRVAGVLAPAGSADDHAVFVDVRTAWIIEGIGHGHIDLASTEDASLILDADDQAIIGSPAVTAYTEITPSDMASFHFHGDPSQYPLTSAIVLPKNPKSATLLKGRFSVTREERLRVPVDVVSEIMRLVVRIRRFFDAAFVVICCVTGLFLVLVVLLSLRLRKREMETMFKMGCSRSTVVRLLVCELGILTAVSVVLAGVLLLGLLLSAPSVVRLM